MAFNGIYTVSVNVNFSQNVDDLSNLSVTDITVVNIVDSRLDRRILDTELQRYENGSKKSTWFRCLICP